MAKENLYDGLMICPHCGGSAKGGWTGEMIMTKCPDQKNCGQKFAGCKKDYDRMVAEVRATKAIVCPVCGDTGQGPNFCQMCGVSLTQKTG